MDDFSLARPAGHLIMGDGSGPDGLAQKDGAKALSRAESGDTATIQLNKPSRTKNLIIESYARYCKEGVGSRRPNWRWLMCFLELPKAKTLCKALVKRLSFSRGSSDDTKSSMTSTRHATCTLARRLPTVYAGRLFLSWRCWSGCRKRL